MTCPTCGARLKRALSYCNHCGANLSSLKFDSGSESSETTTDTLVWVIVGTTITLLGMALGGMVLMKNGSIPEGLGSAFVVLSFAALVLVESVLLLRLLRVNKAARQARYPDAAEDFKTAELGESSPRVLEAPAESVSSVTEQTTRALKPSHKERE